MRKVKVCRTLNGLLKAIDNREPTSQSLIFDEVHQAYSKLKNMRALFEKGGK